MTTLIDQAKRYVILTGPFLKRMSGSETKISLETNGFYFEGIPCFPRSDLKPNRTSRQPCSNHLTFQRTEIRQIRTQTTTVSDLGKKIDNVSCGATI